MSGGADLALRVTVPAAWTEVVGALLMDRLGPFAEEAPDLGRVPVPDSGDVTLVFYPKDAERLSDDELLALLPGEVVDGVVVKIERQAVSRDWVDGWKDHFHPLTIGQVRVRPPWEAPVGEEDGLVDVAINPGLGFGTGLHPTTRGTLTLLQEEAAQNAPPEQGVGETRLAPPAPSAPSAPSAATGPRGALVDVGTGSGILSVAAAKLGWQPVIAFDNDAVALSSARENIVDNGVAHLVEVHECAVEDAPLGWFQGATVLANMTLLPLLTLLRRLSGACPERLVVAGVLAGIQEKQLVGEAASLGFGPGRRLYEAEWVSLELIPGYPAEGG